MADKNRGVQLVDMTQIVESMIFGGTPKNLLNEKSIRQNGTKA